jgi:hypothetical protein
MNEIGKTYKINLTETDHDACKHCPSVNDCVFTVSGLDPVTTHFVIQQLTGGGCTRVQKSVISRKCIELSEEEALIYRMAAEGV